MAWEIDPSHSEATFSVKHMMFATVRGHFNVLSGHLHIDEQQPENSWVDAQVDAASVDTRDERRDGHLRSPDFFDDPCEFGTLLNIAWPFPASPIGSEGDGKRLRTFGKAFAEGVLLHFNQQGTIIIKVALLGTQESLPGLCLPIVCRVSSAFVVLFQHLLAEPPIHSDVVGFFLRRPSQ